MMPARMVAAGFMAALVALDTAAAAQKPDLDILLARIGAYLADYQQRMSAVVADEHYVQKYDHVVVPPERATATRTIASDFAFWAIPGDSAWMGFRDTYAVDGTAVRDRDDRLQRILGGGAANALRQAHQITESNSRYNIGDAPRTINVPTMALGMIHLKNHWRFKTRLAGQESAENRRLWKIEFRESERPTIIRTFEGANQPAKVVAWVDAGTGAVYTTAIVLDSSRASAMTTTITVNYGMDVELGFLVPREMAESYDRKGGRDAHSFQIIATATYTNYRRFQTSGRVVQ